MYLLLVYMDQHHASLHQEDSFHTLGQEQEEALAAIPDIGDSPLIEGTEDIWGANDEDDCTPGELDCNKIVPLLEEENNQHDDDIIVDEPNQANEKDDENSNSTTIHSAPETASLPPNQNHIRRPDITVRGSIRGGQESSSLASPSKKSKSEIIFGERPPPNKQKSKTNQKSSSLASPSSQSKSAIVFGEQRPSVSHGITEKDEKESWLASPSSNSKKSAIVFGERPPAPPTVNTYTKVSSKEDDASKDRSNDEPDVGITTSTTTPKEMAATKNEERIDDEESADTTLSTQTFEDELEVLDQDPDSLLVSKSSADDWV